MIKLNYVYFGLLFLVLLVLHTFHLFILENTLLSSKFLLFFPVLGQCFLEAFVLALAASILEKKGWNSLVVLVVAASCFLLIVHFVDFTLIRIMSFSFWYAVESYVFSESFENFIELLYASNIPILYWFLGTVFALAVPFCGYVIYRFTKKISDKKTFHLSHKASLLSLTLGIAFIVTIGLITSQKFESPQHEMFEKVLPWKTMFFSSENPRLTLQTTLKDPHANLLKLQDQYAKSSFLTKGKPNIYLFVIESLRKDYVTDSITPNLARFKNEHIDFQNTFSNANATQISWFTLFHSVSPLHWKKIESSKWSNGSVPLQVLKKMGYNIRVHTSSRLNYYHMDEIIFGKDKKLLDKLHFFNHDDAIPAWQSDEMTINSLCQELQDPAYQNGTLHIIFLDSSHFPYSWNENASTFTPYGKGINYLEVSCFKTGLEEIKNRYRNSMNYIDSLFGKFYSLLEKQPQWKKSVVVVTGDHGEEFFESGNLFHASKLSIPQTSVPILCKFGEEKFLTSPTTVSHIDIFPSILHYLTRQTFDFDGQSIFLKDKSPYVLTVRYNAGRTPYEFFIHDGKNKLTARFLNKKDIFSCTQLEILSLYNAKDEKLAHDKNIVDGMMPALDKLLGD